MHYVFAREKRPRKQGPRFPHYSMEYYCLSGEESESEESRGFNRAVQPILVSNLRVCAAQGLRCFEARWAMTVLLEAMRRLGAEYASQGKTPTFETLKSFLDPMNASTQPSYEQASDQLQVSVGSVKTLIHRLRKRYTALLREEVGRTVSDPARIDDELRALCEALIAAEGRILP